MGLLTPSEGNVVEVRLPLSKRWTIVEVHSSDETSFLVHDIRIGAFPRYAFDEKGSQWRWHVDTKPGDEEGTP